VFVLSEYGPIGEIAWWFTGRAAEALIVTPAWDAYGAHRSPTLKKQSEPDIFAECVARVLAGVDRSPENRHGLGFHRRSSLVQRIEGGSAARPLERILHPINCAHPPPRELAAGQQVHGELPRRWYRAHARSFKPCMRNSELSP